MDSISLAGVATYGMPNARTKCIRSISKLANTRSRFEVHNRELRHFAWMNMMVITINSAVELGHISLAANGNLWEGASTVNVGNGTPLVFSFFVGDIPAIGHIASFGHGELRISCALWPYENAEKRIGDFREFENTGEVFASGWLERKDGKWLQMNATSANEPNFFCRDYLLLRVADLDVKPLGFERAGKYFR